MHKKSPVFSTRGMVLMALLVAISILLSRFCVIYITSSIRISFGNIPILLAGILFGPVAGAVVGGVSDILGSAFLSGLGWYPPLTLAPILVGVLAGLFRRLVLDNTSYLRTLGLTLITNSAVPMLYTTYFLHILYGTPMTALLAVRVPLYLCMAFLEAVVLYHLCKSKSFLHAVLPQKEVVS